jgi:hypothetical protein
LFLYLAVLVIGCGFFALFVILLVNDEVGPFEAGMLPIVGAICAVYSARQLMRPVPRQTSEEDEDD